MPTALRGHGNLAASMATQGCGHGTLRLISNAEINSVRGPPPMDTARRATPPAWLRRNVQLNGTFLRGKCGFIGFFPTPSGCQGAPVLTAKTFQIPDYCPCLPFVTCGQTAQTAVFSRPFCGNSLLDRLQLSPKNACKRRPLREGLYARRRTREAGKKFRPRQPGGSVDDLRMT